MIHKKFCDGIAKWSKNETASGETRELIKDLILKWHDAGCSQDKEDHAWKVIQKNDTLVVEYITTWKGICYKICSHLHNRPRKSRKIVKSLRIPWNGDHFGINLYDFKSFTN